MTQLLVEYGQKVVLGLTSAPPHPGPSSFPESGLPVRGASAGYRCTFGTTVCPFHSRAVSRWHHPFTVTPKISSPYATQSKWLSP